MKKKIISFLLSLTFAFSFVAGIGIDSGMAIVSEAAKAYSLPYYYNQLSESKQKDYLKIRKAVIAHNKSLTVMKKIDKDTLQQYFALLTWYDPLTFSIDTINYRSSDSATELEFVYRYSKETYTKMADKLKKKADKIVAGFDSDDTTYSKIVEIHDYIIKNTDYVDNGATNDLAYGTLISKKAKCDGYSKAFTYICSRAGIVATNVVGTSEGEGHMWNMVRYNKKWYNIDVTWDDPENNFKDNLSHRFFMVDDDVFYQNHSYSAEDCLGFEVPAASDDSKTYYKVYKKNAQDIKSAKALIKSELVKTLKKHKTTVEIQFDSEQAFEDTISYLYDNSSDELFNLLTAAEKSSGVNFCDEYCVTGDFSDSGIFLIKIFYPNTAATDYYISTAKISSQSKENLRSIGISV